MKQFTIGRMRVVVLIATVGAILIAGAGSTLASEGQQLCIGGSHAAVKPAANGICPQSGELVTLAKQTEDSGLPARVSELESKTTRLDGEVSMLKDKVAELEQKL